MDKVLLELVKDINQWNGNAYTLAALVAERQKEIDRQKLIDLGFTEQAEVI